MPKIKVAGELCVSTELYQNLLERGVLYTESEPENFLCYLQECLARDNRTPINPHRSVDTEQNRVNSITKETVEDDTAPSTKTQSVLPKVEKDSLAVSLSTLYRR